MQFRRVRGGLRHDQANTGRTGRLIFPRGANHDRLQAISDKSILWRLVRPYCIMLLAWTLAILISGTGLTTYHSKTGQPFYIRQFALHPLTPRSRLSIGSGLAYLDHTLWLLHFSHQEKLSVSILSALRHLGRPRARVKSKQYGSPRSEAIPAGSNSVCNMRASRGYSHEFSSQVQDATNTGPRTRTRTSSILRDVFNISTSRRGSAIYRGITSPSFACFP